MTFHRPVFAVVAALAVFVPASAQDKQPPKKEAEARPLLRLEAGGPTSNVTALALSPDGQTLYAAGFDKVVRAWTMKNSRFELNDTISFRVPIGPGLDGAINAIAVSADGQWLAVGGFAVIREGMTFHEAGRLIPAKGGLSHEMRLDRGIITVFNTRDRSVKTLRGHTGPVLSLTFAAGEENGLRLLSASEGWDASAGKANGEAKVWDVLNEKEIAGRLMPSANFARRPGLGLIAKDHAYLAWEDGNVGRWDSGANRLAVKADGKFNTALSVSPGRTAILTTSMQGATGRIQLWWVEAEGLTLGPKFELPAPGAKQYLLPLAVQWLGKGSTDFATVVRQWKDGAPENDWLYLVDGRPESFGQVRAKVSIGGANRIVTALTANKDRIVVGGFPDHRIRVFNPNALAGQAAPVQLLTSAGIPFSQVGFVKKGNDLGLRLGQGQLGSMIFDFTQSKLERQALGWQEDLPAGAAHEVEVQGKKLQFKKGLQILSNGAIKEGTVTATVALPPGKLDLPLFAVASYIPERGSTLLEIFNGKTGEPLRRNVGHLAPIRGLAFSGDGRLLASVADDQTAIVWSLTDLNQIIGRYGSFGETSVEMRGQDLVVVEPAEVKRLQAGDTLRGFINAKGLVIPFKSPGMFYEALWMKKPGDSIKLRVARGGKEETLEIPVRQGVDVRKPLFTLFVPKAEGQKNPDWLGWNAIGPYDSSRRDVEKYLGWHFNTGKADQPTSFAFIDQYRKEYFRPGLLKEMVALGDLPPPPKMAAPKPLLLVPGIGQDGDLAPRVGSEFVVRNKPFFLNITIPGYESLSGDLLTYQVDKDAPRPFGAADGNLWTSSDLQPKKYAPRHRIAVQLKRTPEGFPAQEFRKEIDVRVVAPAPKVSVRGKAAKAEVDDPKYPVIVKLEPGLLGVPFRATVSVERGGRAVQSRDLGPFSEPKEIEIADLVLAPGVNRIAVRAIDDAGAAGPLIEQEAVMDAINVTLREKKVAPPTITLTHIELQDGTTKPIQGASAVVSHKDAAIVGTIKSEEALRLTEWTSSDANARKKLVLDKAGSFRVPLHLKPGEQSFRVFAKTDAGEEVGHQLRLIYRPRLPDLVLMQPEEGFVVSGDGDKAEITVEARFAAESDESYPVRVEVRVITPGANPVEKEAKAELRDGRVTLKNLPLQPGMNEIQVRLSHSWGDERVQEVRGRFIRPPKVASLKQVVDEKRPFVDVTAEILSREAPVKELVRVKVNGKPAAGDVAIAEGKAGSWTVQVKHVPLFADAKKEIKNEIALSVATTEGEVEASFKEPVVFKLPPPPVPRVTMLEPSLREITIAEPSTKVRFQVASASPVTRVELRKGRKTIKRWDNPAELEFSLAEVPLEWGLNHLSIDAINDGGVETVTLNVNVPPQPVRLEIEAIQIAPAGPRLTPDATGTFADLPIGRAILYGAVRWSSTDDGLLLKSKLVRVYVNGFQQLPVELKAAKGNERKRKFEIPVVLNFEKNEIEVELPECKQDATNKRKFPIVCAQPIRGQQLHVLVIAPQERDEAKLIASLSKGLRTSPLGQGVYKTSVFEAVRFYVLAKHVQMLEVSSRLDRIAENLRDRARAGHPNDLVMIYFQGKETVGPQGHTLWTSETAPWLQLTIKDLSRNYLSRFAGGQVLILDTINQAGEIDLSDYRFASLRRPDPRPIAEIARPRLFTELEKEMPRVIWLDQLAESLATRPTYYSYMPDPLRNRIQLNPD